MGSGAPLTLRTPLILLGIADLTVLGMRLWPWPQVFNLPLNGATGIDPAVCLVTYIGLLYWIANDCLPVTRKAFCSGSLLGMLGGLLLAAEVVLGARPPAPDPASLAHLQLGLLAGAGIIWGIAGLRAVQITQSPVMGLIAGLWSAMASALMAVAAVLAEIYRFGGSQLSQDPWKQYEGLAIGTPATQALVHSLNSATGFLLLCPLAGGALGLIFAHFSQSEKS